MKTRLSTAEMLAAIDSCCPLTYSLAKRFRATNPTIQFAELHAVAEFGKLKIAALKFDPSRGNKFITVAHQYIRFELLAFCHLESARGMHVPEAHGPFHAPTSRRGITEEWHHPAVTDDRNELGEDFWVSVSRGLDARDAGVILKMFRDGITQPDVADEMGLTKQRVGQLVKRAMERLRRRGDLKELARDTR